MIGFLRRLKKLILDKPPSRLEWVVIVLIVVVLFALLIPQVQWAGSGQRIIPVVVEVFDAPTGKPIAGARVTVTRGPMPERGTNYEGHFPENIHEGNYSRTEFGKTNENGWVRIEHEFETSSGPSGHYVSLFRCWVCVDARGYGGVAVPISRTPTRREWVVKDGVSQDVVVPIGLFPLDHEEKKPPHPSPLPAEPGRGDKS